MPDQLRMMTSLSVRNSFVIIVVMISQLDVIGVSGHGYLIDPPSRSSAWRVGFQNPKNYDDNGLNCGGFARQWNENGGKCGVCGDPYDAPSPRPNEIGGKYANGIIVGNYTAGQTATMSIVITAHHKGWHEFRVCPAAESLQKPTTQQCLDRNLLTVDNSDRTRYVLPPDSPTGVGLLVAVKLPDGLTCERCVLQWKWRTGNRWGIGPNGTGCLGCGPQEEFINCADISISGTSRSITKKPRSSTPTRSRTTAGARRSTTRTTTTKSAPRSTGRSEPSSGGSADGVCKAIGMFRGISAMEKFCADNCDSPSCPKSLCRCNGSVGYDFTRCKSVHPWNLDDWCITNCAAGFCPSSHCDCPNN